MPGWMSELVLPSVVFGGLFIVWVLIPAPDGESDFASRLRSRFRD
jgi:hypothetical protein